MMSAVFVWIAKLLWVVHMLYSATEAQVQATNNQSAGLQAFYTRVKEGYDKRIRPSFQLNKADDVQVQVTIQDININFEGMEFDAEIYLDLNWVDERLQWNAHDIWDASLHEGLFGSSPPMIMLPNSMFEEFWKPDVFFRNSKSAKRHDVSKTNQGFAIFETGTVIQRERLSLTSHCYFDLHNYPFDYQECGFVIECYKFTENQIKLLWRDDNLSQAVVFENNTVKKAFENEWINLDRIEVVNTSITYGTGRFSQLTGNITIVRDIEETVFRIYVPSILVVLMSLVGFWIDNEDAIDRITLSVTTILTITTMNEGVREGIPKVSYPKAIDTWMLFCTVLIYMALFQSAWVHYIVRCGRKQPAAKKTPKTSEVSGVSPSTTIVEDLENKEPKQTIFYYELKENTPETALIAARNVNGLSKIAFPLVFIIFNIGYWGYYIGRYNQCIYNKNCDY